MTYDAEGNLLDRGARQACDGSTRGPGRSRRRSSLPAFKVVAGPRGTLFLLTGSPNGGRITQVDANGTVVQDDRHRQALAATSTGSPIGRVGFLPSDIEPVGGALLISQTTAGPGASGGSPTAERR